MLPVPVLLFPEFERAGNEGRCARSRVMDGLARRFRPASSALLFTQRRRLQADRPGVIEHDLTVLRRERVRLRRLCC